MEAYYLAKNSLTDAIKDYIEVNRNATAKDILSLVYACDADLDLEHVAKEMNKDIEDVEEGCGNWYTDTINELTIRHGAILTKDSVPSEKITTKHAMIKKPDGEYDLKTFRFRWDGMDEDTYRKYTKGLKDAKWFSRDAVGCIRAGDLCLEFEIHSDVEGGPITEDDDAWLFLELYAGGIDTGYGYGDAGYPYDYVDGVKLDELLDDITYKEFQDRVVDIFIDMVETMNLNYEKTDLIVKATGRPMTW